MALERKPKGSTKAKAETATQAPAQETAAPVAAENIEASVTAGAAVQEAGADSVLETMCDKVEFVASLGDPSNPDTTSVKDDKGVVTKQVTSTIVGYRFKASVPLDIPDVKPGDDFKKNPMSFVGDPSATRHVEPGQEFDLTRFETGMLASREEFNGSFTGGNMPVSVTYNTTQKKGATGAVITASGAATIPSISLRAAIKGQSIKSYPIIDVLQSVSKKVNGSVRKERTIKPGFEKFAPLCATNVRTSSGSGSGVSDVAKRNKGAEAFLQIVQKSAARQG